MHDVDASVVEEGFNDGVAGARVLRGDRLEVSDEGAATVDEVVCVASWPGRARPPPYC